jgi:hypothetical protein
MPSQHEIEVKLLPDKKAILITILICAIVLLLESSFALRKHRVGLEPLYILQFTVLLYFIPAITTRWKIFLYSIAIPFFCCMIVVATNNIDYFSKWEIPFYIKEKNMKDIVEILIKKWIFAPYVLSFSWLISFFSILTCELYFYSLKSNKLHSKKQNIIPFSPFEQIVIKMRLFKHKKLTIAAILIYFIFMMIYFKLYKLLWFENIPTEWTYGIFTYVCLLSFISIFLFAPIMIGRVKRTVAFCVIVPFFWSISIFVLWIILILLFARYQHIVIKNIISIHIYPQIYANQITDILSIHFYLDRYFKIRAWLISFPLLLMCGVYYYLAELELYRKPIAKPYSGTSQSDSTPANTGSGDTSSGSV